MTDEELVAYLSEAVDRYAAERMASGEPANVATRIAAEQTTQLFPGGRPSSGHLLLRIVDDQGGAIGMLWVGPRDPVAPAAWWVWYLEIDEEQRGKGYGRAAMELAETEAKAHGATELGLNVFGHNTVARSLYESLGYAPTTINMRKVLA